ADPPTGADGEQRVAQDRVPHQVEETVDGQAAGRHLRGQGTVVDEDVGRSQSLQETGAGRAAGGGHHRGAEVGGDVDGRLAEGRRRPPDEDGLPGGQPEVLVEGAPGGRVALGYGGQVGGRQGAADGDHVGGGHADQ